MSTTNQLRIEGCITVLILYECSCAFDYAVQTSKLEMTEHSERMWYHLLQQGDELKDPVFIHHVCIV
jgi:hypothetical protein